MGTKLDHDRATVLYVEDSNTHASLMQIVLDRERVAGITMDLARVGTLKDAIAWLADNRADVILLDLWLPDGKGEVENVADIKAACGGAKVIVLTALQDAELAVKCTRAGADDYHCKGELHPGQVILAVRLAVERKRLEEERLKAMALDSNEVFGFIGACSNPDTLWHLRSHVEERLRALGAAGVHSPYAKIAKPPTAAKPEPTPTQPATEVVPVADPTAALPEETGDVEE